MFGLGHQPQIDKRADVLIKPAPTCFEVVALIAAFPFERGILAKVDLTSLIETRIGRAELRATRCCDVVDLGGLASRLAMANRDERD